MVDTIVKFVEYTIKNETVQEFINYRRNKISMYYVRHGAGNHIQLRCYKPVNLITLESVDSMKGSVLYIGTDCSFCLCHSSGNVARFVWLEGDLTIRQRKEYHLYDTFYPHFPGDWESREWKSALFPAITDNLIPLNKEHVFIQ